MHVPLAVPPIAHSRAHLVAPARRVRSDRRPAFLRDGETRAPRQRPHRPIAPPPPAGARTIFPVTPCSAFPAMEHRPRPTRARSPAPRPSLAPRAIAPARHTLIPGARTPYTNSMLAMPRTKVAPNRSMATKPYARWRALIPSGKTPYTNSMLATPPTEVALKRSVATERSDRGGRASQVAEPHTPIHAGSVANQGRWIEVWRQTPMHPWRTLIPSGRIPYTNSALATPPTKVARYRGVATEPHTPIPCRRRCHPRSRGARARRQNPIHRGGRLRSR
jgi:hypothetical protein